WLGGKLRLKQCRDVEQVSRRFNSANLALRSAGYDGEAGFHRSPFVIRIDFEITKEFLYDCVFHIERLQVGTGPQPNLWNGAGKFGRTLSAIGNGARHRIDYDVLRSRIIFRCIRVFDAEDVASAFNQGVLEASAG